MPNVSNGRQRLPLSTEREDADPSERPRLCVLSRLSAHGDTVGPGRARRNGQGRQGAYRMVERFGKREIVYGTVLPLGLHERYLGLDEEQDQPEGNLETVQLYRRRVHRHEHFWRIVDAGGRIDQGPGKYRDGERTAEAGGEEH